MKRGPGGFEGATLPSKKIKMEVSLLRSQGGHRDLQLSRRGKVAWQYLLQM